MGCSCQFLQQLAQFSETNAKEVGQEIDLLTLSVSNVEALREQSVSMPRNRMSFSALTNDDLYNSDGEQDRSVEDGAGCSSAASPSVDGDLETGNPLHHTYRDAPRESSRSPTRLSSSVRSIRKHGRPRNFSIMTNASGGDAEESRSGANSPVQPAGEAGTEPGVLKSDSEEYSLFQMMSPLAMFSNIPAPSPAASSSSVLTVAESPLHKVFVPLPAPVAVSRSDAGAGGPGGTPVKSALGRRRATSYQPSPMSSRMSLSTITEAPNAQGSQLDAAAGSADSLWSEEDSDGYF